MRRKSCFCSKTGEAKYFVKKLNHRSPLQYDKGAFDIILNVTYTTGTGFYCRRDPKHH